MIRNITILLLLSLSFGIDHLLITQVVTQPDAAESFSIYNPTDSPIDLTNYYVCDDEDYYTMQTEGDMAPSHFINGFTARFPDINIDPNDTLTIVLHANYSDYYGDSFSPDLVMYVDQDNSMIETNEGSFGEPVTGNDDPIPKLDNDQELLILFYWDGDFSNLIQDVDYFLWGAFQTPINKTGISTYQDDTPIESQLFFETVAEPYYAYSRIGTDEIDETQTGGNGITGHDETSENFRESWEVREMDWFECDVDAPFYYEDCYGVCGGNAMFDPCGNCDYDSSNDCDLEFIGHPITIDGQFHDWLPLETIYSDSSEMMGMSADFKNIKITYDDEFLFIYFSFYNNEYLLQDWNSFHLYIDSDNDYTTGKFIQGIGAELDWYFGIRSGTQYLGVDEIDISYSDITLRSAPTVTSSEFEIAISRNSNTLTLGSTQDVSDLRIVLSNGISDQDTMPDQNGGIYFEIGQDSVEPPEPLSLKRIQESDIRIVSYNTSETGILDNNRQDNFERILKSLDPDIIVLQEHSIVTDDEIIVLFELIQSWFQEDVWYKSELYQDNIILSRFPILQDSELISSNRTMCALLGTEDEIGENLLIINSHLSCCENNQERQEEVDEFISVWRDWILYGDGPFNLEYETPFVHVGDFNFVGHSQQVKTILYGDIENEEIYGSDFSPDWDNTGIIDLFSRHTHKRMGYTWRKDYSEFSPGKLDYIFYSDATLEIGNHYILNTLAMDEVTLLNYDLELYDTHVASDHMPRVFDIYLVNNNVGDVNSDGLINVSDIVLLVSIIMDNGEYILSGDINGDGYLNILDVIQLVTIILAS